MANTKITADNIAANAITASSITDGTITAAKLAANSVDSDQYVDGSIDLIHMSVNSIDSDQYVRKHRHSSHSRRSSNQC
jgi:trimeric autotransporter adhesin